MVHRRSIRQEEDRIARRETSLQLNSLCKVVSHPLPAFLHLAEQVLCEIRDISRAAANNKNNSRGHVSSPPYAQSKITSARDSKLTLILGSIFLSRSKSPPTCSSTHPRKHQDVVPLTSEGWRRELPNCSPHSHCT